jgi:dTDP-glucose 4,6-dehydratase
MNACITGGAGFIGSEFVRSSINNKFEEFKIYFDKLIVVDSLTYAGNMKNLGEVINDSKIEFVQADIQNEDLMKKIVKNCDLVLNFAAESHVDRSIEKPHNFIDTNIKGLFSLLEAIRFNNTKRFIQISTDEVYGSTLEGSFSEKSYLAPNSPYSASKAAGDLLVRSYTKTYSLNTLITRTCNNFGPYQFPEKLIPVLIKAALSNNPLPIYGSGLNEREWIDVHDNCRAIAFLIANENSFDIVNIGSGVIKSNIEVAQQILKILSTSTSKIEFVEDRKGHDFRYSLDSSLLKSLGFKLTKGFNQTLTECIEWYSKN